jgi:hypothetical protein
MDILRDLEERTNGSFDVVERVALNFDQVAEYGLPLLPGKATDSRAGGFVDTYGALIQVEVDALDPNTLNTLFENSIAAYWDTSTFDRVREREADDLSRLRDAADALDDQDEELDDLDDEELEPEELDDPVVDDALDLDDEELER